MAERALALLDIDNSLREGYILFPLISEMEKSGLIKNGTDKVVKSTAASYKSGSLTYEQFAARVLNDWAQGLRGTSFEEAYSISTEHIARTQDQYFPYARPLLNVLKPTHDIYLVTGEPDFVAKAVQEDLNVTGQLASKFQVQGGRFTGIVENPLASRGDKLAVLSPILNQYSFKHSFALGDSPGDIEMLGATEYPHVVNAKEELIIIAAKHNWHVVNDLNTLPTRVSAIFAELI